MDIIDKYDYIVNSKTGIVKNVSRKVNDVIPEFIHYVGLNDGDEIEVSIKEGTVTLVSSGEVLNGEKIGEYAMKILNAGGIKPLFRAKIKKQQ
ncbi:hypothetical protein [Sedimentibacter sp. LTW-03]|uniref:hypothetical protein n=1 Tax=Sedimentibacter sp. LTW-03 TaxID=3453406 RepID=UPI003F84BDE8